MPCSTPTANDACAVPQPPHPARSALHVQVLVCGRAVRVRRAPQCARRATGSTGRARSARRRPAARPTPRCRRPAAARRAAARASAATAITPRAWPRPQVQPARSCARGPTPPAAPRPPDGPGRRARERAPATRPESARQHHFGRHPDRAVEADDFAVQHRVLEDVPHERRELLRPAEPRRKRHLLRQRLARRLGQRRQQRRVERARRDGHHADADARELARDRQRHADDAALRRRVGRLADLPVERRDRRRVDDDAALAVLVGRRSRPCAAAASRITLKVPIRFTVIDAREVRERLHALPCRARARRRRCRRRSPARRCGRMPRVASWMARLTSASDVTSAWTNRALAPCCAALARPGFGVDVHDDRAAARGHDHVHRGAAQARGAARHEHRPVAKEHSGILHATRAASRCVTRGRWRTTLCGQ